LTKIYSAPRKILKYSKTRANSVNIIDMYWTLILKFLGSSAGAGSGEFHNYQMQKKREQARIKKMEDEAKFVS
jgi:hypothetical protein